MKTPVQLVLALTMALSASAMADHPYNPGGPVVRDHRYPGNGGPVVVRPAPQLVEQVLGTTSLSYSMDRDYISVANCRAIGISQGIRLRVSGAAAYIDSVRVRFENGMMVSLPVGGTYRAGMTTAMINLPGYGQCVDSVWIEGETVEARHYRMGRPSHGGPWGRGGVVRDRRRMPAPIYREARVTVYGLVQASPGIRRF